MTAECLASCGTAPVLQVNGKFVENVTLETADALIDELDRELNANVGAHFIAPTPPTSMGKRAQ
jgi:(2Fe-2S) ferredoxin